MELSLSHTLHLFNIFREYDGKENCAQVLEEELHRIFGIKHVNDEHDCNVVSMNSLNIHDANDMQSHNLGEAMFEEDDIFVECIEFASTHQIGKIDFARGISIWKLNGCKKG